MRSSERKCRRRSEVLRHLDRKLASFSSANTMLLLNRPVPATNLTLSGPIDNLEKLKVEIEALSRPYVF